MMFVKVVPSHSLKYCATLQHTLGSAQVSFCFQFCFQSVEKMKTWPSQGQTQPLMMRVDTKSGHGAGKPTSKSIEEYTDIFCFLVSFSFARFFSNPKHAWFVIGEKPWAAVQEVNTRDHQLSLNARDPVSLKVDVWVQYLLCIPFKNVELNLTTIS